MTSDLLQEVETEILHLRTWVDSYPAAKRSAQWEEEYSGWLGLYSAFAAYVRATSCHEWAESTSARLLYAIARDNEREDLAEIVAENPDNLLCLAERAMTSPEWEARWQLAVQLSCLQPPPPEVEPLLLEFARDDHEYVRRRALLALGHLGSSHVEELAAQAWDSGEEYQRIAALCALEYVESSLIREYAARDEALSTPLLAQYATHIRETGTLRDFHLQGIPVIDSA